MEYQTILYKKKDNIGIIRLNRPDRMNAVIEQMYLDLQDVLKITEADNDVKVLILTGQTREKNGVKKQAFCAGADLKEHSAGKRTREQKRGYIKLAHNTTRAIYEYSKPIIAAINGPARGAGAEMALNCDFIFMANEATIAFPETSLGTFVGGGVTAHLPRLIGLMKAKELVYTGRALDGKSAFLMGIAYECVSITKLINETIAFAKTLAEKAPIPMRYAKKYLQTSIALDIETALYKETEAILVCMETEDWREGIKAFEKKRKPDFKGK